MSRCEEAATQQGHGVVPAQIDGKYAMIAVRTMRTSSDLFDDLH